MTLNQQKTQVLVSIPILTYNGEKYLEEQLNSIYNQTYKNIEVLVFDDCSTDGTKNILEKYNKSHGLKFIINKKNIGLRENSILSFKACIGDYIAPADQDDIWKKDKIEKLIDNIGNNTLIYTDSIPIDENGTQLGDFYFQQYSKLIEGSNNKAFLFSNCISAHAMLFKRELLEDIFPIPDSMYFHDWWIAFVAATCGSIKFLDEPLIYYRRHQEQVTKDKDKNYKNFISRLKIREQNIIQKKLDTIKVLQSFANFKKLDKDTKNIINEIINHMKKFSSIYYNKDFEKILLKHKDDFFAMTIDTNTQKAAKKLARGIWYYRLKLYT